MVDRQPHVAAHETAAGFEQRVPGVGVGGHRDRLAEPAGLQGAALQQVDAWFAVLIDVDGVLDVDRIVVGLGELGEDIAHQRGEVGVVNQAAEVEHLRGLPDRTIVFPQPAQRLGVGGHEQLPVRPDVEFADLGERLGDLFVLVQAHHVDVALGVAGGIGGVDLAGRIVEGDEFGVVGDRAIHGAGAQAQHQPQHAGVRVDVGVPDIQVGRIPDPGRVREEQSLVVVSADPLHQDRHLLVGAVEPPVAAVFEGLTAHRRGVDGAHGVLQRVQPLFGRALIGTEDRFVLAGEGIAEVVFQQRAGAGDDGGLPEVLEHRQELFAHHRWEAPGGEFAVQ